MLTKRIIPCLDVMEGRVVKGMNFVNLRDAGGAVENAKAYEEQMADELCFLDITASHESRKTIVHVVEQVANEVFMPLTVGGGIRDLSDIRDILLAGADKVTINTAAVERPELISEASEMFGSQCICVAIDAKASNGGFEVYTYGGRRPTGVDAVKWARKVEALGAGGDPADEHGQGRHEDRLRHTPHPDNLGGCDYTGHRLGRSGDPRALVRRVGGG